MSDLRAILIAWDRERAVGRSAVLATVVRVAGSTYRGPGARMLLCRDGSVVGLVSGGCLEADLAERARAVAESGESRTVVYDLRSPDDVIWGLGLGCSGEIRVLLERLDPGRTVTQLEFLRRACVDRSSAVVAVAFGVEGTERVRIGDRWLFEADGTLVGEPGSVEVARRIEGEARRALADRRSRVIVCPAHGGTVNLLVEHVAPPVALLIFGAGEDAVPIVRQAATLGWDVIVADPRPAHARIERFPEACNVVVLDADRIEAGLPEIDERSPCVVLTHHFVHDRRILEFLLRSRAPYIGLLGPRRRAERLLAELDSSLRVAGRVHGPAGLDLGAETPAEIALSILAEVQATIAGRGAGFLRDRTEPLHPERTSG